MTLPLHEQIGRDFDRRRTVNMVRLHGGDYVNYDPTTRTFTALVFNKPMTDANKAAFEGCIRRAGLQHTTAAPATHEDTFHPGKFHGYSWVLSRPEGQKATARKTDQISLL